METAPFFSDLADGPANGSAYWITSDDGTRVRIGVWPEGHKGTVLLFPGRTEYIEKYGRAAEELRQRGYATIAIDWRGQGLADRALQTQIIGHVDDFADFQRDVAALLQATSDLKLPTPHVLLAHSMGGCIALRALVNDLSVKAVCFSGPMWGIQMSAAEKPAAWLLSSTARLFGFGACAVPRSTGTESYLNIAPFDGNELTTDPDMFAYMRNQISIHPELALGGPSLTWMNAALREMGALRRLPSPDLPALTFLGTDETIVTQADIRDRMARWPGSQLEVVDGGRHEVMMEAPDMRKRFFDTAVDFFDAHLHDTPAAARA